MADITFTTSDLISTSTGKTVKVVTLAGQMDESNVDELAPKVYQLLTDSPDETGYIFDLENLVYMNSKSIGYLTDWYSKIKEKGGDMVLAKLSSNVQDVLSVVGLTRIVPVAQTMEEAKGLL